MKLVFIIVSAAFALIVPDIPGVVQVNTAYAAKPMPKNRIKHKFNRAAKPKNNIRGKSRPGLKQRFNAQAKPKTKPGPKPKISQHFNAVAKPKFNNKKGKTDKSSPEYTFRGPKFKPPGI